MTVFFVNQFALRPIDKGSLRHFYLAKYLKDKRIDVEIVTSDIHYNSREKLDWVSPFEEYDGVRFRVIKGIRYNSNFGRLVNHIYCAIAFFIYLSINVSASDIILGSSPQPFLAYAAYLVGKLKKAKFIYEVRDLWPQTLIDLGGLSKSHLLVRIMFRIEQELAIGSERVVVLMPLALGYFQEKYGLSLDKIVWIGQGVQISESTESFVGIGRSSEKMYNIVYAGSIGVANRLEFLLDIAKELNYMSLPIHFNVYGDGPIKNELQIKVNRLGLKNFILHGSVSRREVLRKIGMADAAIVLAYSSSLYKYGISFNKIFDYFLVKKPVIFIGEVAANPIDLADAGLVITSNKAQEVAVSIVQFFNQEPSAIIEKGENGFQFLKTHHDYRVIGEKFLKIFSS